MTLLMTPPPATPTDKQLPGLLDNAHKALQTLLEQPHFRVYLAHCLVRGPQTLLSLNQRDGICYYTIANVEGNGVDSPLRTYLALVIPRDAIGKPGYDVKVTLEVRFSGKTDGFEKAAEIRNEEFRELLDTCADSNAIRTLVEECFGVPR